MPKLVTALAVALLALTTVAVAVAAGQSDLRQTDSTLFTTQRVNSPTGLGISIDYFNPQDRAAKPPAVRKIVTHLQPGTRIDPSVVPQCDDVRALAGVCPPGSQVGGGIIQIDTGLPGPARILTEDTVLFAGQGSLIFLTRDRLTGAKLANDAVVSGSTMTSTVPPLPGTPPDGGALKLIQLHIDAMSRGSGAGRRSLVTTPASCPRSRRWINQSAFTYADGITQTVSSSSACTAPTRARVRPRRHHRAPRRAPRPRFTG